jgi:hypothetical protein
VGEAQDAETQALKMGVTGAVERGAVAVVAEAFGVDDQSAIAPEEVHLVALHTRVHLRLGKAVAAAEGEEDALELAAGEVVAPEILRVDQAEVEGATDSSSEKLGRGAVEVAERPLGIRQLDAVAAGHNCGNEGGGAMQPDAPSSVSASVTWDRDLDPLVVPRKHSPQRRGTPVADGCARADRQDGRNAPALEGQARMTNCVDPPMKAMQAAGFRSPRDDWL